MKLFRRLFQQQQRQLKPERSYTEKLVMSEIRVLIDLALTRRNLPARRTIVEQVKQDGMEWFSIRSVRYGDSRSPFGDYRLTCKPTDGTWKWPTWLKSIPTWQFGDIRKEIWQLGQDRMAIRGDNPAKEEHRRTVCDWAVRLLIELFEAEELARLSKPVTVPAGSGYSAPPFGSSQSKPPFGQMT